MKSEYILEPLKQPQIEAKLRSHLSPREPLFAIEASITAASFLSAGAISHQKYRTRFETATCCEVGMLDLFYIVIGVAFFILLWGFTKACDRL